MLKKENIHHICREHTQNYLDNQQHQLNPQVS